MSFPLSEFEHYIEEKVLERGLSYWKKGRVDELEELAKGEYEAIVHGTEDYFVSVSIQKGVVADYSCDCPYDMGPICKHVAALLFALQEENLQGLKETGSSTKKKSKTVSIKIKDILKNLSKEELVDYILEYSKEDSRFRNTFIARFSLNNAILSKESYRNLIKAALKSGMDRHGFIDYYAARSAVKPVNDLLNEANKKIDTGPYEIIIAICQAVIEEMVPALQYADDSDGEIGGPIESAFELLEDLVHTKPEELNRTELFDYCEKESRNQIYQGWDWQWNFIDLAVELIETGEQEKIILDLLDKLPQEGNYEKEQAARTKLRIYELRKTPEEAIDFRDKNISLPFFRREILEEAFKAKDYEKVKKVANEGIQSDKELPGLVHQWENWLFETALAEKDEKLILSYSEKFYLDSGDMKCYKILKEHTPTAQWNGKLEALIKYFSRQSRSYDSHRLASIYIEENRIGDLFSMVKNNPSFYVLESYESYLIKEFRNELVDIYAEAIKQYLLRNVSRSHYKECCRRLRRMKTLDHLNKTEQLISELRTTYKKRPALLEELAKV